MPRPRPTAQLPRVIGIAAALALLPALFCRAPADAAEIKVLTTGAFKPVAQDLAASFEKASGNSVLIENDTAGTIAQRVAAGEAFDLVVLTPSALAELARKGLLAPDPIRNLARVGIGVAVKLGAPRPDISTGAAFRDALLNARKIAILDPAAGGSSGIYMMDLLKRWNLADALKDKLVLVQGGLVATRVVSGDADLAIHQVSEILAVKDATLVGPLPAEIQNYTVYAGAISAKSKEPATARALLEALTGLQARQVLIDRGMLSPD